MLSVTALGSVGSPATEPDPARVEAARGDEDPVDVVSRVFGPWVGVDEDPVTGVAHTVLGPSWARVLGKEEVAARREGGGAACTSSATP